MMTDVLRAVDVDRGLTTLRADLRRYGISVEAAADEAARHWSGIRNALGVATLGMVQLPPLPSWLHDAATVADALVLGPPRAAGLHAGSLRFFAQSARTLEPFAAEMALTGLGLSGLGPFAAQVPAVVGGSSLAPTIVGAVAAVVGSEAGAIVCLILGLALLVVAAWAWGMVAIGAPEAWEREADELEAEDEAPTRGVRDMVRPDDLRGGIIRPGRGGAGEGEDGLELGELVAVAGLLWAVFGR